MNRIAQAMVMLVVTATASAAPAKRSATPHTSKPTASQPARSQPSTSKAAPSQTPVSHAKNTSLPTHAAPATQVSPPAQKKPTPPPAHDDARIVSATFPRAMTTGERRDILVVLRNTGNTVWARAAYHLGDVGADDPFTRVKRVACANDRRVSPGETCEVRLAFIAPRVPGTYRSNWRMLHDGKAWFGETVSGVIRVDGVDAAAIVAAALPSEMRPGVKSKGAAIQVRNVGTTTWIAGRYKLGYFKDTARFTPDVSTLTVTSNVGPGATYTFAITLTAPDELKTRTLEWQMINAAGRPFGPKIVRPMETTVPLLWQQAGIFVAQDAPVMHPSGYNGINNFADVLKSAGIKWIALQVHDGLAITSSAANAGGAAWVKAWRDAGFLVGGWGVEQTNPAAEAALAASLVNSWGLDFYIADAELTYKCDQGTDACDRSAAFVAAMAKAMDDYHVSVPVALSTYGRADLPVEPWRDAGYELLPQAYWNTYVEYQPSVSAGFWNGAGWPRTRIHPTIGMGAWGEGRRTYVSAADYMADLAVARTIGFSLFLVETTPASEWPAIGAGVAAGRARARDTWQP